MDAYTPIKQIGKGAYGTVSMIKRKADGKLLVWKELNYGQMSEKEKELVVSEVNILRELRHPYIIRYYDRIINKATTKLYIVMEYCENGDLGQLIKRCRKEGSYVEEKRIWHVFAQLMLALRTCHRHKEKGKTKPILHRDIKPSNILICKDHSVKLGDFGLAKELGSKSKFATTNVGTPYYMSPEMINETRYNERSDIWAVGCCLYELAALHPPFRASNQLALAVRINAGKFDRIPGRYSEDLHRVIKWMLHLNPNKRPSVEDLERTPQLSALLRDAKCRVREYELQQVYSRRMAELKARSEELAKREAAIREREKQCLRREKELAEYASLLRAKEKQMDKMAAKSDGSSSSAGAGVAEKKLVAAAKKTPSPPIRARSTSSSSSLASAAAAAAAVSQKPSSKVEGKSLDRRSSSSLLSTTTTTTTTSAAAAGTDKAERRSSLEQHRRALRSHSSALNSGTVAGGYGYHYNAAKAKAIAKAKTSATSSSSSTAVAVKANAAGPYQQRRVSRR